MILPLPCSLIFLPLIFLPPFPFACFAVPFSVQRARWFPTNLTASPRTLRLPYGSLFGGAFKILSNFANSKISTPILANSCKGFTPRMSKITNLFAGPYGFTGKIPPATSLHPNFALPSIACVGGSSTLSPLNSGVPSRITHHVALRCTSCCT